MGNKESALGAAAGSAIGGNLLALTLSFTPFAFLAPSVFIAANVGNGVFTGIGAIHHLSGNVSHKNKDSWDSFVVVMNICSVVGIVAAFDKIKENIEKVEKEKDYTSVEMFKDVYDIIAQNFPVANLTTSENREKLKKIFNKISKDINRGVSESDLERRHKIIERMKEEMKNEDMIL